jgi:hypothetical protein
MEPMSDVPKIVHDRLRAKAASGPHPDADVLTAFAEQTLLPTERETMVRHLAHCGECREVVALSLPAVEAVAQPVASGERVGRASSGRAGGGSGTLFAWPNLRWAALAAGVVVVASVVMLRPGKEDKPAVAVLEKQVASAPATTDTAAKSAPPGGESDELRSRAFVIEPSGPKSVKPDRVARAEKLTLRRDQQSAPARTEPQSAPAVSGAVTDNKLAGARETGQFGLKISPAPATETHPGGVTEQVQVEASAQQAQVSTEAANIAQPALQQDTLLARGEAPAPVSKAKAAAANEESAKKAQAGAKETKSVFTYSVSGKALSGQKMLSKDAAARWSLSQGLLRHSLDGVSWQTALQLDHPLLSFGALGNDVWAGGQAGTLFHSGDNGTTWTQVRPSTKSESLNADIVAIEVRSAVEVVLSTRNNESWTTADGGKTWEKK